MSNRHELQVTLRTRCINKVTGTTLEGLLSLTQHKHLKVFGHFSTVRDS